MNSVQVEKTRESIRVSLNVNYPMNYENIFEVFHQGTHYFGVSNDKLMKFPSTFWKNKSQKNLKNPKEQILSAEIRNVDFSDTIASAKVDMTIGKPQGTEECSDYNDLLIINDSWMIMKKKVA